MRLVSIETGLDDIKAHLNTCGCEVIDMADCVRPVQAVIFSGLVASSATSSRLAGSTVLVNAAGKTPQQVADTLNEQLC
ncbi:YkuS family protein [Anaerospora sp.]|uniref:YkuS family protein n=1 Tax=Anaerospora sp. TaxID=1960278 RepID=UPI002899D369|nr:YkuS family protein [Anaerospora sp.]MDF2928604.1 hypothetical protein [Anaerospora sp.]